MTEPLGARKAGSFKAVFKTPDVCKTPMGPATPPVPYPVVSDLSDAVQAVPKVKFNGCQAVVMDQSTVPSCSGDQAGAAKGIKSGTVGGETQLTAGASTVKVAGRPVVRHGDPCMMNNGNCTGTVLTVPPPGGRIGADGTLPPEPPLPPFGSQQLQAAREGRGAFGILLDEQVAKQGGTPTEQAREQMLQALLADPEALRDGLTRLGMEA